MNYCCCCCLTFQLQALPRPKCDWQSCIPGEPERKDVQSSRKTRAHSQTLMNVIAMHMCVYAGVRL